MEAEIEAAELEPGRIPLAGGIAGERGFAASDPGNAGKMRGRGRAPESAGTAGAADAVCRAAGAGVQRPAVADAPAQIGWWRSGERGVDNAQLIPLLEEVEANLGKVAETTVADAGMFPGTVARSRGAGPSVVVAAEWRRVAHSAVNITVRSSPPTKLETK